MENEIRITAAAHGVTNIEIEGIIGTPERVQFASEGDKIATYEKFRQAVERISAIGSREVVVDIRSMGGNVADALLIYDALCALPGRVTTRCWGYVASAATIIAQGASPGRREISANALYLVHRSVGSAKGNGDDLSQTVDLLNRTDQRIASIYADRSGKSAESFISLMNENNGNGRWLSPKEALEASLVDRIIKAAPVDNNAAAMAGELGLPPLPENTALSANRTTGGAGTLPEISVNPKPKNMTLLEKWNAILQIIAQNETSAANLAMPENDAAIRLETLSEEHRAEVAVLQNRIDELEAQNAKLRARPTATKPREDAPLGDPRRTANQQAYEDDIKMFR